MDSSTPATPQTRNPKHAGSRANEDADKPDATPQRKSLSKRPAEFQVHGSYASRVPAVRDPKFHGSTESKQVPAYNNVPDRFELFVLGEDEKKIEYKAVTQIANAAEFTFNKEDHTLANLLRDKLFRMDQVQFVGYKVPHPLFATFELRIQTDGTISPKDVLYKASEELIRELATLDQEFTKEFELKKLAANVPNGGMEI
ncbi:hypothetical protein B0A48_05734 [Cryoendolithus antarcticus]|uniref:DNA-directed RNA polymerase RBP11-like dimerisation domain-containing protein n=1 Tax=Cryoendolithus antarcticus TaxID=1507870 RepID=A0A1V8TC32_9PEZI|nr:hypothetical protein B0A48_05734 [Cryoendolithus antarcticus]OQO22379.1 hypothetical protein B0A51_10579 [Rachicladosporium sp. CCFEE 5018]